MRKSLLNSILLLFALVAGSTNVWAGETTVELTATNLELATFYLDREETVTVDGISYKYYQLNKNHLSQIIAKGSDGYICNTTPFPQDIKSVIITHDSNARQATIQGSADGTTWNDVATGTGSFIADFSSYSYKYFKIVNGTNASCWAKIEIIYDEEILSSAVSFTIKTPSIDYPGTTTYSQAPTTATGYSGDITYEITANTAGATINESLGEVTVAHEGSVTVKATAAAIEGKFTSSYDTYTLTVNDNRTEAPISFPVATAEAMMGEDFDEPLLTNDLGLTVSYSSDNEAVATVNATSGAVTLVAVGTANIIATFAGDATYKYTTAQYELTVNKGAQALPYEESFNKTFGEFTTDEVEVNKIKVWNCVQKSDFAKATSSISGINHNAESWLTSPVIDATNVSHFALSFEQSIDSYFGTIANEAMVYAKSVGDTDWTKLSITYPTTPKDGYYSSFVTTTVDLSAFAGNKMQIAFVYIGTTSKAGAWLVKNVKFSESAVDITVTSDGWATYVTPYALRFAEGDAYIVNATGDKVVYLESVTDVPTDTPVILKGEGTKTATVLTTIPDEVTNLLAISDGTVASCYVLAKKTSGIGFYKWTGGALSAGRVYLPTSVVTSAHEFLGLTLGDETGVNEVRGRRSEGRGEVYDLQGRKVLKPTQGLYIVNGKRVVVK
ncbi:MAG: choice-of-anchor J domain-containing protein [Prevotella sp.]|nr:choice-of-anchor J domain-containing protein [Prevotella sp.]